VRHSDISFSNRATLILLRLFNCAALELRKYGTTFAFSSQLLFRFALLIAFSLTDPGETLSKVIIVLLQVIQLMKWTSVLCVAITSDALSSRKLSSFAGSRMRNNSFVVRFSATSVIY